MPTYQYKCLECDHRFELFQSMTDDPVTKCEKCGGRVKRLIGTGAGFIFKGSGFYCTDYRSDSYRQGASRDKSASSPTTSTSSGNSSKTAVSSTSTPSPAAASTGSDAKKGD